MNLKRMLLLLALSAAISAVAGPQKVKTSVEKGDAHPAGGPPGRKFDGRIHRTVALSG